MLTRLLTLLTATMLAAPLSTPALAEACKKTPAPGGEPGVVAARALQVELCRVRADGTNLASATVVHVARIGAYDIELGLWTYDLARVRLEIVAAASPSGELAPSFKQRTGALFAINGGFFDYGPQQELRPIGLFLDNGRIKNPLGQGLSGTLLIAGHQVKIVTTGSVGDLKGYKFGLQSRPLLVDPGNRLGMHSDDAEPVPRSAICIPDARHVTFVYAGKGGLSLFALATFLQAPVNDGGLGCEVALNLDGGPSTQVAGEVNGEPFERLGQHVVNAIVVLPGR